MTLFPIDSNKNTADRVKRTRQHIYGVLEQIALLAIGFALIAAAASLIPKSAKAFWPFSVNANAEVNIPIPSSSTPVLAAAINSDPNVSAPIALATSDDMALIPYSGPEGSLADVASSTAPDHISVYVVRPGDTLSEIANMYGVSVNTIVWANNLGSDRAVHPGDTLIILPVSGIQHTIVKGDTFKSLASKYGADANEIAEFNGLDPEAPLAVGSSIIIPGGELSTPSSVTHVSGKGRSINEPYLGGSGPSIAGYFSNPLPGGIITQGIHGWNAVDIGAPRGTPIYAAADGTVIIARNNDGWNGGYGNYVVITHANDTETLYAHMTHSIVTPGQVVSSGETIGYVGMTGFATGPHLHFEVRGAANPFGNCAVGTVCSPQ